MINQDVIGINEDKVDSLILAIYDDIEKLNDTLNKIDSEFDRLIMQNDCSSINSLKSKYYDQRKFFPIINANLVKYTEILLKVKNRTYDFSQDLSAQIKKNSKITITK